MTHDSLGGAERQRNIGSRGSSPLRAKLRKLDKLIAWEKEDSQFWFLLLDSQREKKERNLLKMDEKRKRIRNQLKGYAVEGE